MPRRGRLSRRRVSGTLRVGAGAIADEPRGERVHQRGLDLHAQGDLLPRRAPHAAARRGPGGRRPSSSRARRHPACARNGDVQRRRRHRSMHGAMLTNRSRGSFARRSSSRRGRARQRPRVFVSSQKGKPVRMSSCPQARGNFCVPRANIAGFSVVGRYFASTRIRFRIDRTPIARSVTDFERFSLPGERRPTA